MNVKHDFVEWLLKQPTYSMLPATSKQKFIDTSVEFYGFDPFEVSDDLSNTDEIKMKIFSRSNELKANPDYVEFQKKSSAGAPAAIMGKNNYFKFLDLLKNRASTENKIDLSAILEQDIVQSIMNAPDFYFQKGQDALLEWLNFPLSEEVKSDLIRLSKNYKQLQTEAESNEELNAALTKIFEVIAYCDNHAKDKNTYNQYDDKRALADAFVRMNSWTERLIQFRFQKDEVPSGSPLNAFTYLLYPHAGSSILSENHRKQIAENLLKKEYHPEKFVEDLKSFFEVYDLKTTNPNNYTHLLMWVVYSITEKWRTDKEVPTSEFSVLIEEVKQTLQNNPATAELFEFNDTSKTFVWVKDQYDKIGNWLAHYEIAKRRDKVSVEIHFEGSQAEKDVFHQSISTLPEKISWFSWNKSKSIRYEESFLMSDSDIAEKVADALVYLENNIGDQIRQVLSTMNSTTENSKPKQKPGSKSPLNQILFGPPGTGKTYNTINKAISIVNPAFNLSLPRKEVKKEYDRLVNEGQIVFTTFHQSMSYEDFIEGIKPLKPESTDDPVKYDVVPGIFRNICSKAKKIKPKAIAFDWDKPKYYKMSLGGKNKPDLHEWCINNNLIALGWGGDFDLSKYRNLTNWNEFRDQYAEDHPEIVAESRFVIQAAYSFLRMKPNDIVIVSKGNQIIDAIGIVKGEYFWDDKNPIDYYHFRKVEWLATNMDTPPDRFVRKQISQMTIYEFYSTDIIKEEFKKITDPEEDVDESRFVLIIDEINRGNVSQIFGELITLIEKNKRQGNSEALEVILPYSKEKFSVPSNLHIIGTMNTADRSVEALDTALRRRFSFEEIVPNPDLLSPGHILWSFLWDNQDEKWTDPTYIKAEKNLFDLLGVSDKINSSKTSIWDKFEKEGQSESQVNEFPDTEFTGINLKVLLTKINQRIEKLLDKDHQIGHSYFLSTYSFEDLQDVFQNKIIPLLQEYFFGDFSKIGLVLGRGFIDSDPVSDENIFADFDDSDSSDYSGRVIYRLKNISKLEPTEFKKAINLLLKKPIE